MCPAFHILACPDLTGLHLACFRRRLAGHTHLTTTMRYMHLAKGHKEQAIRLLERRTAQHAPTGRVEAGLEAVRG
jgi:hypothetical protein